MTTQPTPGTEPVVQGSKRLMVLLAMAMFVLVVDTSLMNVSISAVDRRPGHHRQRRAVRHRPRGAGLGGVHPDQQQGRRPDRPQAGLRPGAAGVRRRRAGDDAGPEPDRDRHLLGDHRRARRVAAAAGHAVADPRQLRRRRAEAGVRAGRRRGRHRRRGRAAARRLRHDVPVVAGRVRARGRHHRRRAEPDPAGPATSPTPAPARSTWSARSCRSSAWAASCSASWSGRRAASSSCLLMAVGAVALVLAGPVAGPAQARGPGDPARPGPVPRTRTSPPASPGRCCSRSPSAAR